jgi:hypothetical protein
MWSCPLRPEDAETEVAPLLSEIDRSTKPVPSMRAEQAVIVVKRLNFIVVSFPVVFGSFYLYSPIRVVVLTGKA